MDEKLNQLTARLNNYAGEKGDRTPEENLERLKALRAYAEANDFSFPEWAEEEIKRLDVQDAN